MIYSMNFKLWWRKKKKPTNMLYSEAELKVFELQQSLKLSQDKLKCLQNIIVHFNVPVYYEFHNTVKGIPTVVCIHEALTEVSVYNINNNSEANCILKLSAIHEDNMLRIIHISGGSRLGHGSLALKTLTCHAKAKGIERLKVQFLPQDDMARNKLLIFFSKCGFNVKGQIGALLEMEALFRN